MAPAHADQCQVDVKNLEASAPATTAASKKSQALTLTSSQSQSTRARRPGKLMRMVIKGEKLAASRVVNKFGLSKREVAHGWWRIHPRLA